MPSGTLNANTWTKVLWAWGWDRVDYVIVSGAPGTQYRTYPVFRSGTLPASPQGDTVTLEYRFYGDVWLRSTTDTWWSAHPVWQRISRG